MKKLTTTFALLLLLLSLSSCLEIDGQEVTFHFDQENDRVDVLIVYRGIFAESGSGSGEDPLEKAYKDLEQARETGEFVFWNNWPLSVDLSKDIKAPKAALAAHIDVENGGLFTDPQGVLCGYQFVRINDVSGFVKKVNTLLELMIQTGFTGEGMRGLSGKHRLDDDTQELVREFLRSREKMFVFEEGRAELRLPFSAKDHRWLKQQIEEYFFDHMPREVVRREAVAQRRKDGASVTDTTYSEETVVIEGTTLRKEVQRTPSMRFFWDNDMSIVRELELTRIGVGVAGQEQMVVKKASEGLYHDAFLKRLRENGEKIEDGLPVQEIERRFVEFHGRDAVLPKLVAEKRK